jgi:hypothetical protein
MFAGEQLLGDREADDAGTDDPDPLGSGISGPP